MTFNINIMEQSVSIGTTDNNNRKENQNGVRFPFGSNWKRFLNILSEDRINEAEKSLVNYLGTETLDGRKFLDVGSGSGLFSLAARRLGAEVYSFDYDLESVNCTKELKRRFFESDDKWFIEQGSVLDDDYLQSLGTFDIVYAWGVLHHTGDMWKAIDNATKLVKNNGHLFIAIYNDCGKISRWWLKRKKRYCSLPSSVRPIYFLWVWIPVELKSAIAHLLSGKLRTYFLQWTEYKRSRGMSRIHDMIDWLGGYPYEYASIDELIEFHAAKNFSVIKSEENTGYGCHQILFKKND